MTTAWRGSDKREILQSILGRDAVLAIMDLWGYCAERRPDGDLSGMSNRAISVASKWPGQPDDFIDALTDPDVELLDGEAGSYRIHDWADAQPWAAGSDGRTRGAKRKAHTRYRKDGRPHDLTEWCDEQCSALSGFVPGQTANVSTVSRDKRDLPRDKSCSKGTRGTKGPRGPGGQGDRGTKEVDRVAPVTLKQRPRRPGVEQVAEHYCQTYPRNRAQVGRPEALDLISARLADHSPDDLCRAIDGMHDGDNGWYLGKGLTELSRVMKDEEAVGKFMALADAADRPVLTEQSKQTISAAQNWARKMMEDDQEG